MSRRSRIIALALAKSEITDTNADHNENNIPMGERLPPVMGSDGREVFIQTGNDLLNFKYNLRQRSPIKTQNEEISVSKETEEVYSPIISEYVPSESRASCVLAPDVNIESIYEQLAYNTYDEEYNNEQLIENNINILHEIRQNRENNDVIETENQTNEEQPADYIEEQPTGSIRSSLSNENKTRKKIYPKKENAGRKRILNKENWKNTMCKKKKNLGEEFINKKGQLILKKVMKPGCSTNCSRKCCEKITENQRSLIFKDFWDLGDHNKQMEYIRRFVKRVPKKQITASSISTSRRKWSFEYYLLTGEEVRTCKTMFLNTLSISDMWLQTLFKKIDKSTTGHFSYDKRGCHSTRRNAVPEQVKQSVRDHISQIPLVDSHYVRKRSSKLYLDEQLNLPKLHKLYLEWMKENYSDHLVATLRQYRDIFCTEYNIDFNKPKKDQCPRCDLFRNATTADKINLEYEQALHIANKNVVRALKNSDKERAEHSDSVVTACYDLQKILNTPQSEVSAFYYKRKLATYNFTIYDIGKHKGYCYLWDEMIGRKGSNEISSFVFDFIKTKVQEGYKDFNFYSDSCGGQNKNRTVFAMYAYATKLFNIDIKHHFFEVGHSQSEGDAMHALIERRKKHKVIYIPQQWATLIRCAKSSGEPYVVNEVNQEMILDYKQLMLHYNNWEYDVNNAKVSWSKIMHICCASDVPNTIKFQYESLSDSEMTIDLAYRRPVNLRAFTRRTNRSDQIRSETQIEQEIPNYIPKAYKAPLPLSLAKYKDLMTLCKSLAIPAAYHDYFTNLPHLNSTQSKNNSDSE